MTDSAEDGAEKSAHDMLVAEFQFDPVQQSQVAITFGAMHVLHSSALRIIVRFITHQKLVLSSADLAELALIRFLESVQKLRVGSCDLTNGICWTMSIEKVHTSLNFLVATTLTHNATIHSRYGLESVQVARGTVKLQGQASTMHTKFHHPPMLTSST